MKRGQVSSFMQTALFFKKKYASEWAEVQAKFKEGKAVDGIIKKVIDENKPALDALAGQTVTVQP